MARTPDRRPGEADEEGVVFENRPSGEDPTVQGGIRFVDGKFRLRDYLGVYDPRVLPNTGSAGTYGSATQVPVFSTDAQGRVTNVSETSIQIAESQVTNLATDLSNKASTSTTISAGTGLTGGGDLTTNRTISLSNTGSAGTYGSANHVPVFTTDAQGRVTDVSETEILIAESQVTNLSTDLSNRALTSTSITAGTGLSGGGDLTTNRTISLSNTGSAGTHGSATQIPVFDTDAQGRVTAVTNTAVDLSSRVPTTTTISAGTGLTGGGDLSTNRTFSIDNSVVATLTGSNFSGVVNFNGGLSGSLTRLTDGTSYLIAGPNITIRTGSNGSIQITGSAGGGGGGGTPGGSDTYVQFNDSGVFGGDSTFTFDKNTSTLSVPTITSSVGIHVNNLTVLGTASIAYLETLGQQSLKVGDKFITILSGSSDHASLDGAGLLFGSGSTGPTVDDQGANAHLVYREASDSLEVYPNLSVTGKASIAQNVEVTGSLYASSISGSLTRLIDGSPFIVDNGNMNVTVNSSGQILLSTVNSGTIHGVTAGTGLSGGGTSWIVTLNLSNTGSAGTHGSSTSVPVFDTDAQGRVTAVTNTSIDFSSRVPTTRNVNTGVGLSGGGSLASDLTISLSNTGSAGTYGSSSQSTVITTDDQGRVNNVSTPSIQIAESQVTGLVTDLSNKADTSTTITAGTGLIGGGNLTTNRTISLSNTGSAGTYGTASQVPVFDTDAQGRVTAVSNTNIQITESQVTNLTSDLSGKASTSTTITAGTGLTGGGDLSTNRTISLSNTGSAGTYGSATQVPVFATDDQGRVTSATNTSIQIAESQVTSLTTDLGNRALTSTTITAGTGLTGGGDLSTNRTLSLSNTGSAGTYGSATQVPVFATDAQGRVTSVTNTSIEIAESQVTNLTTDLAAKAPNTSSYVLVSADASLTNDRTLTAGTAITITDGGAGSTVTVNVDTTNSALVNYGQMIAITSFNYLV